MGKCLAGASRKVTPPSPPLPPSTTSYSFLSPKVPPRGIAPPAPLAGDLLLIENKRFYLSIAKHEFVRNHNHKAAVTKD